jgi:hypothetical protein
MNRIVGANYDLVLHGDHIVAVCNVDGAHPVRANTALLAVIKKYGDVKNRIRNSDTPPTMTVFFEANTDVLAIAADISRALNQLAASDFVYNYSEEKVAAQLAVDSLPMQLGD